MELGGWELVAEVQVAEIETRKEGFDFGERATLAENPGEKFELGDVVFSVDMVIIDGVADEI